MARDEAFRHEQRRVAGGMALAVIVTGVVLALAAFREPDGPALAVAERLQSALRADVFVVAWLAAAIGNVARLRFVSRDDIAGSSHGSGSQPVREAVAILQNTAEQVVLAVLSHLALAAILGRPGSMLVALAALFCAGRALFWAGYGRGAAGRALGFALTFYPSVAALGLAAATLALGRAG